MLCSTDQQLPMFQHNCLSQLQGSSSLSLAVCFRLAHINRLDVLKTYTYNYVLFLQTRQLRQSGTIDCDIWPDAVSLVWWLYFRGMDAICVTVKGNVLHAVTQGDQGFVKRSSGVEFIQYDNITVKMSWLFFVKTLQSLCDTELKTVNCSVI